MHSLVITGGTFDTLHAGHKALLRKALKSGKRILIGLCTDGFARRRKGYKVQGYAERKRALESFLGPEKGRVKIVPISDDCGPALTMRGADAIVASAETEGRAREISRLREKAGLRPLKLITVPVVYAEDLKKIASDRIRKGKISAGGGLLGPVLFAVGTTNPSKLSGVRAIAEKAVPRARVVGVKVPSEIPAQPFGKETISGAINRAVSAFREAGADYGVGLESGIFSFYGRSFDVQWCAIYDGENATLGFSMGFEVPPPVAERLKRGKEDMAQVFEEITGIRGIGRKKGAIGYLSGGITERRYMSEQAFLCAIIPRLNAAAYKKKVINQYL